MQQIAESRLPHVARHLEVLGPFQDQVLHSQVLTMTFVDSEITDGGIIKPPKSRDEDRFQSKIGLVIAMGPGAFKDDTIAQFHGKVLKVHDWVLMRPADGMEIFFNGCTLRLFEDVNIKAIISDPTMYW
jgi:co-chaperonin GroES (HSP10)